MSWVMTFIEQERSWYDCEESAVVDNVSLEKINNLNFTPKPNIKRKTYREDERDEWEAEQMKRNLSVSTESSIIEPDRPMEYLIFHREKPLFAKKLNLKEISNLHFQEISTCKDTTSDIAVMSRKGSKVIRELREQKQKIRLDDSVSSSKSSMNFSQTALKKTENFKHNSHMASSLLPFSSLDANKIKKQRQFLPAFFVRDQILKAIRENQVVIIIGETGSGKTTQITQFLLEDGFASHGMIIGCTQPRRVAAMSVAKRVSEEMNSKLGDLVGYAIRFEDCTSSNTKIKYMTDGVLLREALRDSELEKYSSIIIDEAHERSLQTDILLGLIKQILKKRNDIRIIVTSATMNAEKFSEFFGSARVFHIPGKTYPVEVIYNKTSCDDYVDFSVRQTLTIHQSHPIGDILIFMTGQEDIEGTCEILSNRCNQIDSSSSLLILPIYSQLPSDLQAKIFEKAPEGSRKCIIATNIAETSLTVDGIIYVVDTGLCKLKVYNSRIGMDVLQISPISQAAADQRRGRAGRTSPGICYRIYTESTFKNDLFRNNIPEIQRTNLCNVVLLLKSLNISDIFLFPFIDPPPFENIASSMYHLWMLGALDTFGNLTSNGNQMIGFPLDPPLARMLVAANSFGCIKEIVTIVSMLSVPGIFQRSKKKDEETDPNREKFMIPQSDHLTLLNIFEQWEKNKSESWSIKNFIQQRSMEKVFDIRRQLLDILESDSVKISSAGLDWELVKKCLTIAYVFKVAKIKGFGEYVDLRTGMSCFLHPSSSLYGFGQMPEYVVYHELVLTSKEYMQCVTAIEPMWLAESCPSFYSIRIVGNSNFTHKPVLQAIVEPRLEEEKSLIETKTSNQSKKLKKLFKKSFGI